MVEPCKQPARPAFAGQGGNAGDKLMKATSLVLFLFATMTGYLPGQVPGTVKSLSFSNNSATVVFLGSPDYLYDVQRSTNFGAWVTLETTNVPISGQFQASDFFLDLAGHAPAMAFYRLRMPGPAATLAVTGFPSPQTAGLAGNVTVTAKNSGGGTATGYRGTVHFTSSDGQALLPGDYAFTSADAGVHTFSLTLKTAGAQSITATDTVASSITGAQSGITVSAAAATTLTASGFPNPQTAGLTNNATVTAKDAFGNTAANYRGTIHFTSSDSQAVLPGDYTFTAGDNGAHAFAVALKTAGSQSITATDTVNASLTATQSAITVNPAAASSLTVAGFPNPQTAGAASNVTVTAKDPFGNLA